MGVMVLEGLRPWLVQRVSAVIVATYLVYVTVSLLLAGEPGYASWRDWLYAPHNSLLLGLFVLAILFHAWIGMRDVVLDYIHHTMLRLTVLSAIVVLLILCGLWSLRILLIPLAS